MTTLTIGLLILVFVVFMYTMMTKKGGGCCGGHGHQEPQKGGGCCGGDEQPESHAHHGSESGGSTTKDPVCGMSVDEKSGLSSEHDGKHYAFCSEGCQKSFDADPGKYV